MDDKDDTEADMHAHAQADETGGLKMRLKSWL